MEWGAILVAIISVGSAFVAFVSFCEAEQEKAAHSKAGAARPVEERRVKVA